MCPPSYSHTSKRNEFHRPRKDVFQSTLIGNDGVLSLVKLCLLRPRATRRRWSAWRPSSWHHVPTVGTKRVVVLDIHRLRSNRTTKSSIWTETLPGLRGSQCELKLAVETQSVKGRAMPLQMTRAQNKACRTIETHALPSCLGWGS